MCDFCEKKFIRMDGTVNGTGCCNTMQTNLDFLFGGLGITEERENDGVKLEVEDGKPALVYDSSSGEYNSQFIYITYCPFCGRKIEGD